MRKSSIIMAAVLAACAVGTAGSAWAHESSGRGVSGVADHEAGVHFGRDASRRGIRLADADDWRYRRHGYYGYGVPVYPAYRGYYAPYYGGWAVSPGYAGWPYGYGYGAPSPGYYGWAPVTPGYVGWPGYGYGYGPSYGYGYGPSFGFGVNIGL